MEYLSVRLVEYCNTGEAQRLKEFLYQNAIQGIEL